MKKYLITFGLDSFYKDSVVLVSSDSEEKVREYVYSKYGRLNVAWIYNYETDKHLIQKYHYKIIEDIEI